MKKSTDFNNFWCTTSWRNLTPENYNFTHPLYKLSPHYLAKCTALGITASVSNHFLHLLDPPHHLFFCPIIHILIHNLFSRFHAPTSLSGFLNLQTNTFLFHPVIVFYTFLRTCPYCPNLFLCTTFRPTVFFLFLTAVLIQCKTVYPDILK